MPWLGSKIFELAASVSPQRVAAAFFDKTVQIWDADSRKQVGEFQCWYRGGADLLALAPSGRILVTGRSSSAAKVAAYEIPSGELLWEHRNLQYPSKARFDREGKSVLLNIHSKSTVRLDAQTGERVAYFRGYSRYFEGQAGQTLFSRASPLGQPTPVKDGFAESLQPVVVYERKPLRISPFTLSKGGLKFRVQPLENELIMDASAANHESPRDPV